MNYTQLMWLYLNIIQDEEEDNEAWLERLDYIGFYIDPERAKGVTAYKEKEKRKRNNIQNGNIQSNNINNNLENETEFMNIPKDEYYNDEFEKELAEAMKDDKDGFIELPDAEHVGDDNLTLEEFLNNVQTNISELDNIFKNNLKETGDISNSNQNIYPLNIENLDNDIDIIEPD